ncbi:hypothetical protein, partial [Herpetosiphon gulosus]|uniref:hypothetical protein n=1 Tax=Herpetosiphon gulosus TaxID=1973496 RepID=UPI0031E9724E
ANQRSVTIDDLRKPKNGYGHYDSGSVADDEGDPGDDVPDQHKGSSRPDQNGSQPMESVSLDISTQGIRTDVGLVGCAKNR